MNTLTEKPPVEIETLYEITQGLEKCLLLFTGMDLQIFEHLTMSKSVEEISQELRIDSVMFEKFLNSLTATGFIKKEGTLYRNTPIADAFLVKESPFYQGNLLNLIKKGREQRWGILPDILKKGPRKIEGSHTVFDKSFSYAMAEGALRGGLQDTMQAVSALPEFASARRLLDLGGAHGLYAIGFAQANPGLKSIVFDLPGSIDAAKESIEKYNISDWVSVMTGDFSKDDLGSGYDIVFASDVFYRPMDAVLPILRNIYSSLNTDGLFISKHWTIHECRTAPITTVLFDLMMSLNESFRSYIFTDSEFAEIVTQAGFENIEMLDISSNSKPSKILTARKI